MIKEMNKDRKLYRQKYYLLNKEKIKASSKKHYQKNGERIRMVQNTRRKTGEYKEYLKKNKEKISLQNAMWYKKHQKERNKKTKEYYLANREKILRKQNEYDKSHRPEIRSYCKERRGWNFQYRLSTTLRSRLVSALRGNLNGKMRAGSAVRDLGCTIPELKLYLEERFQEGMEWDNWGHFGWHIDHDIPLALFDLTNREQFIQAFHYTNLQPMWWKENLNKRKNIKSFLIDRSLDKQKRRE